MRTVFADSCYWVALLNRNDVFHERAVSAERLLGPIRFLTTDEVLAEFLDFFSGMGALGRQGAAQFARRILRHPRVEVVPQSRESFLAALALYESRPDKGYSLTDCAAMLAVRERGVTEVLTNDHHFEQEGFVILLRD
jgi:predicted nucleic acid-binding protein